MIFQSSDIKKVKNVKRAGGTDWAYFDLSEKDRFKLNFSKPQLKGARELLPGEIILLFQKVDKISGVAPRTYLTHLVTPLNTNVRQNFDLDHKWNWELEVGVIARAEPRTAIYSSPNFLNFHKPNWGRLCDIQLLNSSRSVDSIQLEIWNYFQPFFNANFESLLIPDLVTEAEITNAFGFTEGKQFEVNKTHLLRERNSVVVWLAKSRAFQKNAGRVHCACCNFSFYDTYGSHGLYFIEAHHRLPIKTGGERITFPEDLALVCANCHRMLHRKKQGTDEFFTVEELAEHIERNFKFSISSKDI